MNRRNFIKQSSIALAGLPLLDFHQFEFLNDSFNPDFPYTNDFPATKEIFKLFRKQIFFSNIVMSRGVENATGLMHGTGPALLNGSQFPSTLILDAGKEIVGDYAFIASSKQPCEITITYGEGLDEVLNGFAGINWYQHPKDVFSITEQKQKYFLKGCRAYRYFRIDTTGDVTLHSLEVFLQHYPVEEKGYFSCSDVMLNQIWQVSQYTTKLCMQQYYEDGIKRDGLLWVSDYRIQFLCNAYTFGDAALARKSLFMIAASQRKDGAIPACAAYGGGHQHPHNINYMGKIPFSFGAHWILINYSSDFLSCLLDYITYTEDKSILPPLIPTIERLLNFLETVSYHQYSDMPMGRDRLTDDAALPKEQKGILEGAFLFQVYINFKDGEKLLAPYNRQLAERCSKLAQKVASIIHAHHYNATHKLYRDFAGHPLQFSWHTNAFAVLSGIALPTDALSLLQHTDAHATIEPASGNMKMYQLMALLEAGWTQKAVEEMKRYWGLQIKEGATTFWEYLKLNSNTSNWWESALMSRCHGWSAGPAFLLPRYFLGVRPTTSWSEVIIQPCMDMLEWAEGKIPTPYGMISVAWEKGKKVQIILPEGIKATWKGQGETKTLKGKGSFEFSLT